MDGLPRLCNEASSSMKRASPYIVLHTSSLQLFVSSLKLDSLLNCQAMLLSRKDFELYGISCQI